MGWAGWLQRALDQRDWKPSELTKRSGGAISSSQLTRWLAGDYLPKLDAIRAVCAVLGVPPVEGMIAAGHLVPEDVGATITGSWQIHEVSNPELLGELARRLDQLDYIAMSNDPQVVQAESDHETPNGGKRPAPIRLRDEDEGVRTAARRRSP